MPSTEQCGNMVPTTPWRQRWALVCSPTPWAPRTAAPAAHVSSPDGQHGGKFKWLEPEKRLWRPGGSRAANRVTGSRGRRPRSRPRGVGHRPHPALEAESESSLRGWESLGEAAIGCYASSADEASRGGREARRPPLMSTHRQVPASDGGPQVLGLSIR